MSTLVEIVIATTSATSDQTAKLVGADAKLHLGLDPAQDSDSPVRLVERFSRPRVKAARPSLTSSICEKISGTLTETKSRKRQ